MILIIEGANKVGKSTVIQNLKSIYGEENVVNVYERQGDDDILFTQCRKKMLKHINYAVGMSNLRYLEILEKMHPEKIFILDRFHLTECVYGDLVRNYNALDTFKAIDESCSRLNVKLLLLNSLFEHIEDKDELAKLDLIQRKMSKAYDASILHKLSYWFVKESELSNEAILTTLIKSLKSL